MLFKNKCYKLLTSNIKIAQCISSLNINLTKKFYANFSRNLSSTTQFKIYSAMLENGDKILTKFDDKSLSQTNSSEIVKIGSLAEDLAHYVQDSKNIYDKLLFVKFSNLINDDRDSIHELLDSKILKNASKPIVIPLLEHISNICTSNGTNSTNNPLNFDAMIKIANKFLELNHFNYSNIIKIEEYFLSQKDIADITSMANCIKLFSKIDWKTEDEYFGDILSRFITSNIHKCNYNQYAILIEDFGNYKFTHKFCWQYLEYDFISKFTKLYNPLSLDKIVTGFNEKGLDEMIVWNLIENFLKNNNSYLIKYKRVICHIYSILVRQKNPSESLVVLTTSLLSQFEVYSYSDLSWFIDSVYNWIKSEKGNNVEILLEKIGRYYISLFNKMDANNLANITIKLVKYNLTGKINFKSLTHSQIARFANLGCFYKQKLEILHNLSELEPRLIAIAEQVIKSEKWDLTSSNSEKNLSNYEPLITTFMYLHKYREEVQNKVYQIVLNNFFNDIKFSIEKEEASNSNFVIELLLIALPFYRHLVQTDKNMKIIYSDKIINQFLAGNSKDGFYLYKNYDHILILANLDSQMLLDKSRLKLPSEIDDNVKSGQLRVDIEYAPCIKLIKDIGNLSIKTLDNLYNCKFFSSKYETV